ncbi:MAG: peptidylprolyl isomerase [Betaproteobacteria bacterium]|nr:peptidylprolyl isomerase [Betaproteobacteria bacterium]
MKSNSKKPSLFLCAVLALAVTAADAADSKPDARGEVVAKMGTIEIRRGEVEQVLGLKGGEALPPMAQINQALRGELLRRAVLEEARRQEWEKRPEVRQQIERAKEQVIVSGFVNNQARPPADYPSETEIKAAYEANKSRFMQPAQFHLQQIFVADTGADQKGAEAAAQRADELWKLAREKGADFAELARKHSGHAESAAKGGDMGWLAENALIPDIRTMIQGLGAGEVSKPVKSPNGWHILKLIERKAPAQQTLVEVRDSLVQSLRLSKASENEQKYLSQLVGKIPVTVNEVALSTLKGAAK